jgi:hypothetical protein
MPEPQRGGEDPAGERLVRRKHREFGLRLEQDDARAGRGDPDPVAERDVIEP